MAALPSASITTLLARSTVPRAAACCGRAANGCASRPIPNSPPGCGNPGRKMSTACKAISPRLCGRRMCRRSKPGSSTTTIASMTTRRAATWATSRSGASADRCCAAAGVLPSLPPGGGSPLVPATAVEILSARPDAARLAVLPDRLFARPERPVQTVVPERRHGSGQPGTLRIRFRQYEVRSEQSGQFEMHRRHRSRSRSGNGGLRARLAAVQGTGLSGRMVETEQSQFRTCLRADCKTIVVRTGRAGQPDR